MKHFPLLSISSVCCAVSLMLVAEAGQYTDYKVLVDLEDRVVQGAFQNARLDPNSRVMLSCQSSVSYPSDATALLYGVCLARDADDNFAQCTTYNTQFIERIQNIDMRGAVRFAYDENGNCTTLETGVYSALLP